MERGFTYGPNFLLEETGFGLRGLLFGEDFEINVEEAYKRSMQGKVDFGYQLAICTSLRT